MQAILGLVGMVVMLALIVGYFRLQFVAIARWGGWYSALAALPLAAWALWLTILIRDLNRDPTSHNLFPFEMLMLAGCAGGYLLVLWIARLIHQRVAA